MTDHPFLSPGSTINGRYEIVCKLSGDSYRSYDDDYLAIDRDRDGKKCVITELIFQEYWKLESLEERELVEKEVKLVSHLRHPQIQTLQSLWVEHGTDESLLLISDYIQGETYLDLLNHRRQHQQVFSESEVVDFLFRILPVVDYIHRAGVKYSHISPENIICRDRDRLPVPIDVGSIEILARTIIQNRTKYYGYWSPSYRPFEVLAGHIHPSSDLYTLALTALTLLTGKNIGELYDFYSVDTFDFQVKELCEAVNLSPELVTILERSLKYNCKDRYQSATAVIETLLPIATSTYLLSYRLGLVSGANKNVLQP
jgi:serine/threonine protein kinase